MSNMWAEISADISIHLFIAHYSLFIGGRECRSDPAVTP